MGKMYQLALLLWTALLGPGLSQHAASTDWCSLSVRVLSPSGQRPGTYVTVREQNGRTIEKEVQPPEDIRFCDLGILPVSVEVGLPGCNQVLVRDVPLMAGEMYLLTVTYDIEPCVAGKKAPPPVPLCETLLRVTGPEGSWIVGAEVAFDDVTYMPSRTDVSGRLLVVLSLSQRLSGVVRASGLSPRRFELTCTRDSQRQEQLLRLNRQ